MRPKVSIIMPVLNGERFIGEAIESILAQTYPHYELIVIDDGSIDSTAEKVASFRDKLELQYVRHGEPWGIARSMNDGLRHATGNLISFLDHDDAWFPQFLETEASYLEHHPDVAMVHSDFQTIDADGNVIEESVAKARRRKRPAGRVFRELFLDSFIVGNSVLIRKECFTQLGMFDESLRWGDYHMWLRIARHYPVDYLDKVLTKYRQHPTQSTRSTSPPSRPDADSVGLQAIRKILDLYPEVRQELGERTIRKRISFLYFDMGYLWSSKEAFGNARTCLGHAIRTWPFDHRYYMHYAATLLAPSQSVALKRVWRRARLLFSRA